MKLLYITLLLGITAVYAQDKKVSYLDENSKPLTETEYTAKLDNKVMVEAASVKGNTTIKKLYTRKVSGNLKAEDVDYLRSYLQIISGREVNPEKPIVINYYPGKETEVRGLSKASIYQRDYGVKLNRIAECEQFWIYKSDENLTYNHGKKLDWKEDRLHYIESTYFPVHFNFGSFIIIYPSGKYVKYYGEYGKETVWEALKDIAGQDEAK